MPNSPSRRRQSTWSATAQLESDPARRTLAPFDRLDALASPHEAWRAVSVRSTSACRLSPSAACTGWPPGVLADHYRVRDAATLAAALAAQPDVSGDAPQSWHREIRGGDGQLRSLAAINPGSEADRIEVLYRAQTLADEGPAGFEAPAGAAVHHPARETTDPAGSLARAGEAGCVLPVPVGRAGDPERTRGDALPGTELMRPARTEQPLAEPRIRQAVAPGRTGYAGPHGWHTSHRCRPEPCVANTTSSTTVSARVLLSKGISAPQPAIWRPEPVLAFSKFNLLSYLPS